MTDNLYQQNIEIASKNKSLSTLRKLYEISILTLDPKELAQKMAEIIQQELAFEFVNVLQFDKEKKLFRPLGSSSSARLETVETELQFSLGGLSVSLVDNELIGEAVKTKSGLNTEDISRLWRTQIEKKDCKKLKEDAHIKLLVISPLQIDSHVTGLVVFGINRDYSQLTDHEIESLNNLNNIIAVAIDRSVLYEKLRMTNTELETANERQHSLMRFINHQVKGFFTRSRVIFDSLKNDHAKELSEEITKLVDVGYETTTQAVETVRALLEASNLKDGTMQYQKVKLNFRALVVDIVKPLEAVAAEKGLELKMSISGQDVVIVADITQITQVIRNLVENAINYTKTGSVEVILDTDLDKKIATFEVVDSGIGLTDEDMETLFTEGGRGNRAKAQNVNSTGYGLFIAKQIVEQHEGTIAASSLGENKGSRFTVKLPIV